MQRNSKLALLFLILNISLANAQGITPTGGGSGGGTPSGPAGGDLGGSYPNPTVTNGSHITNASVPNSGLATPAPCSTFGTTAGTCAQGGVITAAGPIGSATVAPILTFNAAGQLTTVTSATVTPAVSSITGLGTGVGIALAASINATGGFVTTDGTATFTNKTFDTAGAGNILRINTQGITGVSGGSNTLLAINGSGASLTALNATQLTSGTVPDARLQPISFKVYLSASQSVTTGATTKVLFDTVDFDTASAWSASTHVYTPTIAGTYNFCVSTVATGTFVLGNSLVTQISKNGTIGGTGVSQNDLVQTINGTVGVSDSFSGCTLVAMNGTTDTVEVDINFGGTGPAVFGSAGRPTQFTGNRTGP